MTTNSPAAPDATAPTVKIDIWSDVACPWCYVGKRR
ncbi:MAG: disulfide bond formation protein DsbA, partial [Cellulosimicrobium sp.]|nr:disulfide bond formation protein DsbA [Cellulosimicrobium sp.]